MMTYRDELYHYGLKGMKWGQRRWQNEDGTFNEAGKKRYFGEGAGENYHKRSDKNKNVKNKITEKEELDNKKRLSDKQKETLKKAAIIGVSVAAAGLAAYGAYKLNDKATKSLMETYADVGQIFSDAAFSSERQALSLRELANQAESRNSTNQMNLMTRSADHHDALSRLGYGAANKMYNKVRSGNFGVKERVNAAAKIAVKGNDAFQLEKREELFRNAQNEINKQARKLRYGN